MGGKVSTSWKKGQSGNPKGRPRSGQSWRDLIEQVGEETQDEDGTSKKIAVARAMYREAINGNDKAASWLARYGGGTTEFSDLSTEQLRAAIAARFGIDPSSITEGDTADTDQEEG